MLILVIFLQLVLDGLGGVLYVTHFHKHIFKCRYTNSVASQIQRLQILIK